jgi:hypothetical protein
MSPEEFAKQTGLSLEEAEMVLRMRQKPGSVVEVMLPGGFSGPQGKRFLAAMDALNRAEKKVGVAPVRLEGEEILKGDLPVRVINQPNPYPPLPTWDGRVVDDSEDYKQ